MLDLAQLIRELAGLVQRDPLRAPAGRRPHRAPTGHHAGRTRARLATSRPGRGRPYAHDRVVSRTPGVRLNGQANGIGVAPRPSDLPAPPAGQAEFVHLVQHLAPRPARATWHGGPLVRQPAPACRRPAGVYRTCCTSGTHLESSHELAAIPFAQHVRSPADDPGHDDGPVPGQPGAAARFRDGSRRQRLDAEPLRDARRERPAGRPGGRRKTAMWRASLPKPADEPLQLRAIAPVINQLGVARERFHEACQPSNPT